MCAARKKWDGKAKELVLWVLWDKGINRVDQKMMQDLEGLESW